MPSTAPGSDIAAIELSRLTRQYLDRRINDLDLLNVERTTWQEATNNGQRLVDWRFRTTNCRIKLQTPSRLPTA